MTTTTTANTSTTNHHNPHHDGTVVILDSMGNNNCPIDQILQLNEENSISNNNDSRERNKNGVTSQLENGTNKTNVQNGTSTTTMNINHHAPVRASFTPVEEYVLHSLLVDYSYNDIQNARKKLNDDILFTATPLEWNNNANLNTNSSNKDNNNNDSVNIGSTNHRSINHHQTSIMIPQPSTQKDDCQSFLFGLWKSFVKDNIHPKQLMKQMSSITANSNKTTFDNVVMSGQQQTNHPHHRCLSEMNRNNNDLLQSFASNEEVRHGKPRTTRNKKDSSSKNNKNRDEDEVIDSNGIVRRTSSMAVNDDDDDNDKSSQHTESSSIVNDDDDDDDNVNHGKSYNANKINVWNVLKDEYSQDFGYSYGFSPRSNTILQNPISNGMKNNNNTIHENTNHITNITDDEYNEYDLDDDTAGNTFQILGASILLDNDNNNKHNYVLSPPLMDSIMSFLPDQLQGQNYWLKYSLIHDGSSLNTMKHYILPCQYTVLAIETTNGNVFGCFTSSAWTNHNEGFYGTSPSFVWKMRYNRYDNTNTTLYEQAQLESCIDVYMPTNKAQKLQVCNSKGIAIGGDESMVIDNETNTNTDGSIKTSTSTTGFAIALLETNDNYSNYDNNLVRGTTSRSKIFNSPSLIGNGDQTEIFDIANLEVWTFTPCFDIPSAQRLEMTKYYLSTSTSTVLDSSTTSLSRTNSILPAPTPASSPKQQQQRQQRQVSTRSISPISNRNIRVPYSNTNNNTNNPSIRSIDTSGSVGTDNNSNNRPYPRQKQYSYDNSTANDRRLQYALQQEQQDLFYKKIGDDPENEIRRELYQYQNTITNHQSNGLGPSPKFPI